MEELDLSVSELLDRIKHTSLICPIHNLILRSAKGYGRRLAEFPSQKDAGVLEILLKRGLNDVDLQILVDSSYLSNLATLNLKFNEITDTGVQALTASLLRFKLSSLFLDYNHIGNTGAQALAVSSLSSSLKLLSLRGNRITATGAEALLLSPNLRNLRTLNLSDNAATL